MYNVICGKLNRGKRLTTEEIDFIKKRFEQYERNHAIWKEYPCLWECSLCGKWIHMPDKIQFYKYCPRCGAKMEVER